MRQRSQFGDEGESRPTRGRSRFSEDEPHFVKQPGMQDSWTESAAGPNRKKMRRAERKAKRDDAKQQRIQANEARRTANTAKRYAAPRPTTATTMQKASKKTSREARELRRAREPRQAQTAAVAKEEKRDSRVGKRARPGETKRERLSKRQDDDVSSDAPSVAPGPPTTSARQKTTPSGRKPPRVGVPSDVIAAMVQDTMDANLGRNDETPAASASSTVDLALAGVPAEVTTAVRRICNKLTVANTAAMATELLDLFEVQAFPRAAVVSAFCAHLRNGLLHHTNVTSAIALGYAGVLRALQLRHGNIAAGRVFEVVAWECTAALSAAGSAAGGKDDAAATSTASIREFVSKNTGIFLAHCLLLHCSDPALVTSFIRECVEVATPESLQAALAAVRACGDRLRKDCPAELNGLVDGAERVLQRPNPDPAFPRVRLSVFVETLRSIAAGKLKTSADAGAIGEVDTAGVASVRSQLEAMVLAQEGSKAAKGNKRIFARAVVTASVLRCDFVQCAAPKKDLQWWNAAPTAPVTDQGDSSSSPLRPTKVSRTELRSTAVSPESDAEDEVDDDSNFSDFDEEYEEEAFDDDEDAEPEEEEEETSVVPAEEDEAEQPDDDDDEDTEETAAARKKRQLKAERTVESAASGQRLSTELRRKIFLSVAHSADDADCFHRLMQLGAATATHLNDIAAVLLQCAVQSTTVNLFYPRVLQRLASGQRKFKLTLQFALWDRFKAVFQNDIDVRGYLNLSATVVFLIQQNVFGLNLLRGLDLDQGIDKKCGLFLRVLLLRALLALSPKSLADFFFGASARGGGEGGGDTGDVSASASATKQAMRKALLKFFKDFFLDEETAKGWMPALIDVVGADLGLRPDDVEQLPVKMRITKHALRDGV